MHSSECKLIRIVVLLQQHHSCLHWQMSEPELPNHVALVRLPHIYLLTSIGIAIELNDYSLILHSFNPKCFRMEVLPCNVCSIGSIVLWPGGLGVGGARRIARLPKQI